MSDLSLSRLVSNFKTSEILDLGADAFALILYIAMGDGACSRAKIDERLRVAFPSGKYSDGVRLKVTD